MWNGFSKRDVDEFHSEYTRYIEEKQIPLVKYGNNDVIMWWYPNVDPNRKWFFISV